MRYLVIGLAALTAGCDGLRSQSDATARPVASASPATTGALATADQGKRTAANDILDCAGTIEVQHRGYPAERASREPFRLAFTYSPGENTSVHLFNVATKSFEEACSYDCQTMGSKDDWSLRSGFSAARQATTAMGSTIRTTEMAYRGGHLSSHEEYQAMTQMGPVMEVTRTEAECKPFDPDRAA